jgi:hypothetical protein
LSADNKGRHAISNGVNAFMQDDPKKPAGLQDLFGGHSACQNLKKVTVIGQIF